MRVELCDINVNSKKYATNLRYDSTEGLLKWDNSPGQDVLIVQTPFAMDLTEYIDILAKALSQKNELSEDWYENIYEKIYIMYVSAAKKSQNGGCAINGKACMYTVLACDYSEGLCRVYRPQMQAVINPFCNVPIEINIKLHNETKTEGFFRKRQIYTGFYSMNISSGSVENYSDGDVFYMVEDLEIPITKKMFNKKLYIKTTKIPTVITKNKGIKLIEK